MGRFQGKVALVTGAARGQGRSLAVRLAEEGADIIAIDKCEQISTAMPMATAEDLAETVRLVEALDRRIIAAHADVRDYAVLRGALETGIAELGHLDILCANAGIASYAPAHEMTEETWCDVVDTNMKGVWHAAKASAPYLIANGGGSMVFTSSTAGLRGFENMAHYSAAKHGVVGLMKTMALELAPYMIRVNTVNPTTINTPLVHNRPTYSLFAPDLVDPTIEDIAPRFQATNVLPVPWVEPDDVSNAVLFLASDESRYITGLTLTVDAGQLLR